MVSYFETIDYDYSTDILDKSALDMVFKSDGILLGTYSGYKVIDQRELMHVNE